MPAPQPWHDTAARLRRRELGAVECLEYFRERVARLDISGLATSRRDRTLSYVALAWREFLREWTNVLCPISATVALEHLHSACRGRPSSRSSYLPAAARLTE